MAESRNEENDQAQLAEEEIFSGGKESPRALCVELDFAVLPGIQAYQQACARVLAEEKNFSLDPFGFARFCVKSSLPRSLALMKAASGPETEELAGKIHAAVAERLLDSDGRPREGMPELVRAIRDAGVRVILVSQLPEESLPERIESLGLSGEPVKFHAARPDRTVGYGPDQWKKIAAHESIVPRGSLALVGGGFSAKSALAAGFKVLAFPDEAVVFEDYSGVDGVFEPGERGVESLAMDLLAV